MDTPHMPPVPPMVPPSSDDHDKIVMSKRSLVLLIVSLVIGLSICIGIIFYLFVFQYNTTHDPVDNVSYTTHDPYFDMNTHYTDRDARSTEPILLSTDSLFSRYIESEQGKKDFTPSLEGQDIEVEWYQGARPLNTEQKALMARLQERIDMSLYLQEEINELGVGQVYGFVAGTITSPELLAGKPLYLVSTKEVGMGLYFTQHFVIYDVTSDRYVFVEHEESESCSYSSLCEDYVSHTFDDIEKPPYINISGQDDMLVSTGYLSESDHEFPGFEEPGLIDNRGGVLDVMSGKIARAPSGTPMFTDPQYGPVYFVDDQFRIIMPDGAVQIYDYIPYFFDLTDIKARKSMYEVSSELNVQWKPGYETQDAYLPAGDIVMSCGWRQLSFPNIVDGNVWFDETQLVPVAETLRGDTLYAIKDPSNIEYYQKMYEIGMEASLMQTGEDELNLSDEEKWQRFLADTPLVYWQDGWGHWRAFRKAKYQPLAECGKPVIYLYPEQEMDVHVQVEPDGGFSITDPDYGDDGWYVRASRDSELYNYADGQQYEYLFWEGYAYNYEVPCYGWVMSREDVPTRMHELLSKQGMKDKEITDFMEFWEEKLTVSPYVYVTFLPQSTFDRMAPLTVDPAPDTVVRVFMDYMPLESSVHVDEPYIRTPERTGFTVVEWGGRLH